MPTEGTKNSEGKSRPPSRLFRRHRDADYGFLLGCTGVGSVPEPLFAGSNPTAQLIVERSGEARLWNGRTWIAVRGNPLRSIEDFVEASRARPPAAIRGLPVDTALPRTVGYLAYELGCYIENVPAVGVDDVGLPLAVLSTYDEIDVETVDGVTDTIGFAQVKSAVPVPASAVRLFPSSTRSPGPPADDVALAAYASGFARIAEAIRAGEIYQANLTRRLVFEYDRDPFDLWCRLTARQPVPYATFLDLGTAQLLGNSPERFLRIRGDRISTCPIKGTRPRASDPETDAALARELSSDRKEAAEHVMIVDLERNDLGRVCVPSSIKVERLASVASFATLHHLESEVQGTLRDEIGFADILRATFPGGSITGAPKIKAMEIIAEVEPQARGVYTGAVGRFNGCRETDLSIAIRTAIVAGGRVHYGTGGGIVADSRIETELDETLTKARAMVEAISEIEPNSRVVAS